MKKVLIITDNLKNQINGVVTTYNNIEKYANLDGYEFYYLNPSSFKYMSAPLYPELKLCLPFNIGGKISEIDPDFVHCATEGPMGMSARRYLAVHGYCYNTAYHTKFPEAMKKILGIPEKLTWPIIRWFHSNSNKVLTTTESMVSELRKHGFGDNVVAWTRGVDRDVFKPEPRQTQCTKPLLVCVSRISAEKNLEAFFKLCYPGATKIMVGDGPKLEEYRKLYPDVIFTGAKRGTALAHYFQQADVFVFPSRWDTFGLVMIEAMACGTPVAAYPVQGPLDVIEPGVTGFLDEDLKLAVDKCLTLDRKTVHSGSLRWSWEAAWKIFKDNLVELKK